MLLTKRYTQRMHTLLIRINPTYAYATAECNFNNGYGDFVQSVYVRKIDGYMVFISAISNSADSNDVLVNNITKAN